MKPLFVFPILLTLYLCQSNTTVCNQMLMESFDILGQHTPVTDRNYICPGVYANCCSLSSQLEIYKRWIVNGEKHKIKKFYQEFPIVFDRIFSAFQQIEILAEHVIDATTGVQGSNCNRIATVIKMGSASLLREHVVAAAKEATTYLFKAREGMYCSICDADNHVFYNNTNFTMTLSNKFCATFVENVMPFYSFKYDHFIKLARLYAQFVTTCSLRGVYSPNSFLRNDVKFFKHKRFFSDLRVCRKGISKPGAINACGPFCQKFNPVKYDESLEGELDKLASYVHYLERRIRRLKHQEKKEAEAEKEAGHPYVRRILSESEHEPVHKPDLDEEVDELIAFNRQFQGALLRPIPYHFKADLTVKYNVQFDEPIIKTGFEKLYDLVDYKARFADVGIDYNSYGQMAVIERDTAMKVFEILNPEKTLGISLDDYLKTKKE